MSLDQFSFEAADPDESHGATGLTSGASGRSDDNQFFWEISGCRLRRVYCAWTTLRPGPNPTSFRFSDTRQQPHCLLGALDRLEAAIGAREQQRAFELAEHQGRDQICIG